MQWFVTNWFWLLVGIAFVSMHLFGHGGHGGHRGLDDRDRPATDDGDQESLRNRDAGSTSGPHH
jgi:hypothetical protein